MAPDRQLIDWHTHCYLPEHTGAESQETMRARGVIGGEAWPDLHRRGVAEGGAEKFVVIKMPTKWGRGIPNDFIAEYVGRYPGRAVGFTAIDPTEGDAAAELERCVTKLGLRGLKLSPVYHGYDPWSPRSGASTRWPTRSGYRSCSTWAVPTIRKRRSSGAAPSCWTGSPGRSRACG